MFLRLLALALLLLVPCRALAQFAVIEATPVDRFNESYDASVPVSGSPLVGLRVGDLSALKSNNVVVVSPPSADNGVCMRVTTRDGRYSAANFYALPAGARGDLVRVTPVTQSYRPQLSGYPVDEVAVRAFASPTPDCSPGGAINLPLYDGNPTLTPHLVVFANGNSMPAKASLYRAGTDGAADGSPPISSADCTSAGGSMIAFDLICSLPLTPETAGQAVLTIEFSDGFSTDSYSYLALIPRLAAP